MTGCRIRRPGRHLSRLLRLRRPSSYRTALHRSPFPNQVFFYFRTKSHSLLTQGKSSLDRAARDLVELDAEDDNVRAERTWFGSAASGACETLPHEGERGLDRVAVELFVGAVGDHAPPTSLSVVVVLVHLHADPWVVAQHGGLAALGGDRHDRAVFVGVDERHHVRRPGTVATEPCDPLFA